MFLFVGQKLHQPCARLPDRRRFILPPFLRQKIPTRLFFKIYLWPLPFEKFLFTGFTARDRLRPFGALRGAGGCKARGRSHSDRSPLSTCSFQVACLPFSCSFFSMVFFPPGFRSELNRTKIFAIYFCHHHFCRHFFLAPLFLRFLAPQLCQFFFGPLFFPLPSPGGDPKGARRWRSGTPSGGKWGTSRRVWPTPPAPCPAAGPRARRDRPPDPWWVTYMLLLKVRTPSRADASGGEGGGVPPALFY